MRAAVAVAGVAALVACSDKAEMAAPDASESDAQVAPGADGGPDAGGPAGAFPEPGDYELRWELESGAGDMPATVYKRVSIGFDRLYFWYPSCRECGVEDIATRDGDCLRGQGIPQGTAGPTDAYELCLEDGNGVGLVSHTGYPGPQAEVVWRARAVPLP